MLPYLYITLSICLILATVALIQYLRAATALRRFQAFPVLIPPDGVDIWNEGDPAMQKLLADTRKFVSDVHNGNLEGAVVPPGWTFTRP